MQPEAEGLRLSPNDVLSGEILQANDHNSFLLAKEFRSAYDKYNYFGCAVTFMNIEAPTASTVPKTLREVIPECRTSEYFTWKVG
jgi:hypothetical protein